MNVCHFVCHSERFCFVLLFQEQFNKYERAIYAALSGNLKQVNSHLTDFILWFFFPLVFSHYLNMSSFPAAVTCVRVVGGHSVGVFPGDGGHSGRAGNLFFWSGQ